MKRIGEGEPSRFEQFHNNISAGYSYMPNDKLYFNVRLRLVFSNNPHMDIKSKVYNADNMDDFTYSSNMNHNGKVKPMFDIYYQRTLSKGQTFAFNVTVYVMGSHFAV